MRRWRSVLALSLAAWALIPGVVQAQDTTGVRLPDILPSGATYPLFFDDFDYPVAVQYDARTRTGPDGSLLGPNAWWVGLPGDTLSLRRSRAWYAENWLEGPGNTGRWWSDGPYFLDTTRRPGELVIRAEGIVARSDGRAAEIRSGFSARTGTWLARVRLPDFDGLRHHSDGEAVPLSMFPSFWAQSSFATETRTPYYFGGKEASWFEWNFEINNWVEPSWPYGLPACPPGRRPRQDPPECVWRLHGGAISTGVVWAMGELYGQPSRWASYTDNPVPGDTAPGNCFVLTESGSRVGTPAECFAILTGTAFGSQDGPRPTYAYLQAIITPESSRFAILVRDEDAEGRPGSFREGFELMVMDTPPFTNLVTPTSMQALFSLSFGWGGTEADSLALPEPKEFGVDWMLYTPAVDRSIFMQAADGLALKAWLDARPDAPRRVHTIPWETATGREPRPLESRFAPFRNPCHRLGRSAPTLPFDFDVEVRVHDETPYFLAVLSDTDSTSLRVHQADVRWEAVALAPSGAPRALETVERQGFGLVGQERAWQRAESIEMTVTLSIVLSEPIGPGQWEKRVLDPECYGIEGGAMNTRRHRYRYTPSTGTLEQVE